MQMYRKPLPKAGEDVKLEYNPNKKTKTKKEYNTVWSTIQQKCGYESWPLLFKIIKHFPRQHKLHKISNKNTVKARYSDMKNIESIINSQNKKNVHINWPFPKEQKCNCINKEFRPLKANSQAENIVYEASVTCNEQNYGKHIYIGIPETTFKKWHSNNKRSFNLAVYKNDAIFSKEFWKIKQKFCLLIKSRILRKCSCFNQSSLRCNLCLNEKLEITLSKGNNILNRRTEQISKWRHVSKHAPLQHNTKD